MIKLIGLMLLGLIAFGVVVAGSDFLSQSQESVVVETIVEETPSPKVVKQVVKATPSPVSAQKLFSHVQKLSFRRYTDAERGRSRTYIIQELQKLGWRPQLEKFSQGVNIFASRPGTNPEAGAILIGAHYDTVANSPGADDNASGVAVLLEIARLLGRETPRTLQLAFFDQEEAGLRGSLAYAAQPTHLQDLRGAIVLDMVGYACYSSGCQKYPEGLPVTPPTDKGDFIAVVGDTEHLPLLNSFQKVTTRLPPVLTLPVPLKGLLVPDLLRSDHAPFWVRGIGAVLITDTANLRTPHYHQPSDTPENIERKFFTGVAQVVVNVTTELLAGDGSLETPVDS